MAKVFIEETTLTNIGNAIRDKEGSSALIPVTDMATRIAAIETGGGGGGDSGIPEEAFNLTGTFLYRFCQNNWNWFLNKYGKQCTTSSITALNFAFNNSKDLTEIPFQINCYNVGQLQSVFNTCYSLTECPKLRGTFLKSTSFDSTDMIKEVSRVRDFEDLFDPAELDGFDTVLAQQWSCPKFVKFENCRSMRRVPSWFYKFKFSKESTQYPYYGYSITNRTFAYCHVLDEVLDFPTPVCAGEQTSNMFEGIVGSCYRLKNFTFDTDNGTPHVVKWKNQTLSFSDGAGYVPPGSVDYITVSYNSGITKDKQVTDDASYQALKDDPDWFGELAYSRYNHDSAVATINSLPDTSAYLASAGGTNTIRFRTGAGANTDGGAVDSLTEEEIAVAAAKGWTVTLV